MNGKNRRVRGCWSRGRSSFTKKTPNIKYKLPQFSYNLIKNLNTEQKNVLYYFQNYRYVNKYEEYTYNSNTPRALIKVRNSHFKNGTLRITRPGIYILQENIYFEPNLDNDFMPQSKDIVLNKYPVGDKGAYHLGFFAAITIETAGVILDLNSFSIQQTKLHNLQQRFYANIELANSPFIPKQGPAVFSTKNTYKASSFVLIMNGKLGLSSHHGIHGNDMKNIIINNMIIEHFEVAGIALNGTQTGIITNTIIQNAAQDIPVLSTYSQSRFIRSFLNKMPNDSIKINNISRTKFDIINKLNATLEITKNEIVKGNYSNKFITSTLFKNASGLYDGNVYGLVLNVNGVVIGGFIRNRNKAIGNTNIHLQNLTISNIVSEPIEVIGISNPTPKGEGAYGISSQAGPIGDILPIKNILNKDNTYKENPLANSQIYIAHHNQPTKHGTTTITMPVCDWATSISKSDIYDIKANNKYYFVNGQDSMGHTMKGNLGLFISAGRSITGSNIFINSIKNIGLKVGHNTLIPDSSKNLLGAMSAGVLITGSEDVQLNKMTIKKIHSDGGEQHLIYTINSTNIKTDSILVSNNE